MASSKDYLQFVLEQLSEFIKLHHINQVVIAILYLSLLIRPQRSFCQS